MRRSIVIRLNRWVATAVLILTTSLIMAQGPLPTLDLTDLLGRVYASNPAEPLTISDVHISTAGLPGGMRHLADYVKAHFPGNVDAKGNINLEYPLVFDHCTFDDVNFSKVKFGDLSITSTTMADVQFAKCTFGAFQFDSNTLSNSLEISDSQLKGFEMKSNYIDYEVDIQNDSIRGDTNIESNRIDKGELALSGLYINGSVTMGDNAVTGVLLEKSVIDIPSYGQFNNYKLPGNDTNDLYLTGNEFRGDTTTSVVFNKGQYLNLDVRENHFMTNVYFSENEVDERFFLVKNIFDRHISFEKFLFSQIWNEIYWDQLSGYKLRYIDYAGQSKAELKDDVSFKNLVNIYKSMQTIFLSRGDLESSNGCYSEMKQLEGRMLKHIYLTQGGFRNFLRWQLNVLLKVYTDHGTDPGLAVLMSFFVILSFGLLYLFFPSEWDKDSINRLLISYEQLLQRKGRTRVIPVFVVVGSILLTLVNALTLSINSFVTLGFGSIPTSGFSRYLCIIEGFIGWFLLSIFTVALINQVLA